MFYFLGFETEPIDPSTVKAGPLAFWLLMALIVATVFLMISFARHIRKVRKNFGVDQPTEDQSQDD